MIRHWSAIGAEVRVNAGEITPGVDEDAKVNELAISASQNMVTQLERATAAVTGWHQRLEWHIRRDRQVEALAPTITQPFDLATVEMLLNQKRARDVGA